jgi:ABC-2 type transport system permease protein
MNSTKPLVNKHPSYTKVFLTFARNSLVRDMTFRGNFLLQCITSVSWTMMNLGFFIIVFEHTQSIGSETGWGRNEFFVFLATTWLVNSIVQAFFMPNADEFSELIRTGNLDFALLKPIDTQFLVSFAKVEWSALANFVMALLLLGYSTWQLSVDDVNPLPLNPIAFLLYAIYVCCGALIMYSLMISLSATSIWLGRNQSLYDFWFYLTNFCRYPMEIYQRGRIGWSLWGIFTFGLPILVAINVPARILAQPLRPNESPFTLWLAGFTLIATVMSLLASRFIFRRALLSYRSASS